MDMLIIGTTTNLKPPFCSNCSCYRPDPRAKPVCTGCDGCARPSHWAGMTLGQSRAQLSMWSILKSPLLASADLLAVNQSIIDIFTNTEVLGVSDDPLGKEGLRLGDSGRQDKSIGEIFVCPLENGKFAVCMFNRGSHAVNMTFEEVFGRSFAPLCAGCQLVGESPLKCCMLRARVRRWICTGSSFPAL